jgi:hypothetical protein
MDEHIKSIIDTLFFDKIKKIKKDGDRMVLFQKMVILFPSHREYIQKLFDDTTREKLGLIADTSPKEIVYDGFKYKDKLYFKYNNRIYNNKADLVGVINGVDEHNMPVYLFFDELVIDIVDISSFSSK